MLTTQGCNKGACHESLRPGRIRVNVLGNRDTLWPVCAVAAPWLKLLN